MKFCPECGKPLPSQPVESCPECGSKLPSASARFCPECGFNMASVLAPDTSKSPGHPAPTVPSAPSHVSGAAAGAAPPWVSSGRTGDLWSISAQGKPLLAFALCATAAVIDLIVAFYLLRGPYVFGVPYLADNAIVGIMSGAMVLLGTAMLYIQPQRHQAWGGIVVLFSILTIFGSFGGIVVGFSLGLIGGIIGFSWRLGTPQA